MQRKRSLMGWCGGGGSAGISTLDVTWCLIIQLTIVFQKPETHSAMSRYPQEAAAWRGIQPSLSGWLMPAPCSTRNVTMSTLSSMHAWEKEERGAKWDDSKSVRVYHGYDACNSGMVCVLTPLLLHGEGKCTASDRLSRAFRVVWGFWCWSDPKNACT